MKGGCLQRIVQNKSVVDQLVDGQLSRSTPTMVLLCLTSIALHPTSPGREIGPIDDKFLIYGI